MIYLENRSQLHIVLDQLETIALHQTKRDIELIICSDSEIATLNEKHRGISRSTDVLSFPITGDHAHLPLGTIIISIDHAKLKASELGHTVDEEITLLFIHGLLHLLGYDHETDDGQMRQKEHELIDSYSLPKSLIIRTETS